MSQMQIPGTERPKIPAIEQAAEAYVTIRDRRMKLTEQEVSARSKLIEVMEKNHDKLTPSGDNGSLCYYFDEEVVILSDQKKVKVKTAHGEVDEETEQG